MPELELGERLEIASQLRETLGKVNEHAPPQKNDDTSNTYEITAKAIGALDVIGNKI